MVQLVGKLSPNPWFEGRWQGLAHYTICFHHMGCDPAASLNVLVVERPTDLQANSHFSLVVGSIQVPEGGEEGGALGSKA